MPKWLEWSAAAGSALGGAAAVVAVVIALLTLRAWKLQRQREKRSEVAARVLAAILRAADAFSMLSLYVTVNSTLGPGKSVGPDAFASALRSGFLKRLEAARRDAGRELDEALIQAAIHLRDPEVGPLIRLQIVPTTIHLDLSGWLAKVEKAGITPELVSERRRLETQWTAEILRIRSAAVHLLRPVVNLENRNAWAELDRAWHLQDEMIAKMEQRPGVTPTASPPMPGQREA